MEELMIQIPPLREHREDIPWLIEVMLTKLEQKLRRRPRITAAALNAISRYAFPGNVRELWNLIERLAVTTDAEFIDVHRLPVELSATSTAASLASRRGGTFREALQRAEAAILKETMERFRTQTLAAKHLGLGQATISRKLKKCGLQ
jgi:transcriptional regulator with PAS, ATPase and Fis domain